MMIDGTEFKSDTVLVEESLLETMLRLGKARYEPREYKDRQIREARLDSVKARDNREWTTRFSEDILRSPVDWRVWIGNGEHLREKYPKLPAGEPKWNLPIQYICMLLGWEKESAGKVKRAKDSFLNVYPSPYSRCAGRKLGYFCRGSCNVLYQKTLKLADPELH